MQFYMYRQTEQTNKVSVKLTCCLIYNMQFIRVYSLPIAYGIRPNIALLM